MSAIRIISAAFRPTINLHAEGTPVRGLDGCFKQWNRISGGEQVHRGRRMDRDYGGQCHHILRSKACCRNLYLPHAQSTPPAPRVIVMRHRSPSLPRRRIRIGRCGLSITAN